MKAFDWLAKGAAIRPDKTALVEVSSNRRLTYSQLNERASRFARFLQQVWHIEPGDRIAVLAHNSTTLFELLYACAKSGAILAPLNWRLAPPELASILEDCTPRALLHDDTFTDVARRLCREASIRHILSLGLTDPDGYESAIGDADGPLFTMSPRDMDEVWYILYTSGTTGRPKGVLQTFSMVLVNMLNIAAPIELTASDTTLTVLPMFHTGGLNMYGNPTLLLGGTVVVPQAFDAAEALTLLSRGVTAIFAVPAIYQLLAQHPDFETTDLSGVRSWACGGSSMPVPLLEQYAARGITICQGYGMTETGPTVFIVDPEHALDKAGSVGTPQRHVDVRIVDARGGDVPVGELGELLIRGPGVTPGYWRRPDATAAAIVDGWLHSGDVARHDDEGYFYIVDRIKDMFVSGGENVYPAEIENVLHSHPAVAEAAVVAVPDERWGEVGRAYVALRPGSRPDEESILGFCSGKLARYKIPKSVVFVDTLPRNAAGKVAKAELRGVPTGELV